MSGLKLNRVIPVIIMIGVLVSAIGFSKSIDLESLDFSGIMDIIGLKDGSEEVQTASSEYLSKIQTSDVFIDMYSDCVDIVDGDTIRLSSGDFIRLADLQAPELGEVGYAQSRNELTRLLLGQEVYLDVDAVKDIYGRYVCVVYLENGAGFTNINNYMVVNEYAEIWETDNQFNASTWGFTEKIDLSYSFDAETFTSEGVYIGSKKTNIYHKPGCSEAQDISKLTEFWFDSEEEAKVDEYQACPVCPLNR
jgi:hypothetical protein